MTQPAPRRAADPAARRIRIGRHPAVRSLRLLAVFAAIVVVVLLFWSADPEAVRLTALGVAAPLALIWAIATALWVIRPSSAVVDPLAGTIALGRRRAVPLGSITRAWGSKSPSATVLAIAESEGPFLRLVDMPLLGDRRSDWAELARILPSTGIPDDPEDAGLVVGREVATALAWRIARSGDAEPPR